MAIRATAVINHGAPDDGRKNAFHSEIAAKADNRARAAGPINLSNTIVIRASRTDWPGLRSGRFFSGVRISRFGPAGAAVSSCKGKG